MKPKQKQPNATAEIAAAISALEANDGPPPTEKEVVSKIVKLKHCSREEAANIVQGALDGGMLQLVDDEEGGEPLCRLVDQKPNSSPMKLHQSDDLSDRVLAVVRSAPKKEYLSLAGIQELFRDAHPIKPGQDDLLGDLIKSAVEDLVGRSLLKPNRTGQWFGLPKDDGDETDPMLEDDADGTLSPSTSSATARGRRLSRESGRTRKSSATDDGDNASGTKRTHRLSEGSSTATGASSRNELKGLQVRTVLPKLTRWLIFQDSLTRFFTPGTSRRSRTLIGMTVQRTASTSPAAEEGNRMMKPTTSKACLLSVFSTAFFVLQHSELFVDTQVANAQKSKPLKSHTPASRSASSATAGTPSPATRRSDQLEDSLTRKFTPSSEKRARLQKGDYLLLGSGVAPKRRSGGKYIPAMCIP
ncbi:hypothetical protein AAVH_29290 [Aphelenchoides avenae]|nr:hypothetical protein AAVH_29290 [Aphelenchus avenae]